MARRVLGADSAELEAAYVALTRVRSLEEIDGLIDEHPVMRHPAFHAGVRDWWDSLQTGDEAGRAVLAQVMFDLHVRAHAEWCALPGEHSVSVGPQPPSPYAEVLDLLSGVAFEGPDVPFDTYAEADALRDFLQGIAGPAVDLPPPGRSVARWNLGVMTCAGCGEERVVCRAHAIELATVAADVHAGRFEDASCDICGDTRAMAYQMVMYDPPLVADPLAALSTIIRVDEQVLILRPPAGGQDRPETRRLLEFRLRSLARDLGWDEEPEANFRIFLVVYSHEDLVRRLAALTDRAVPLPMETLVDEISQKLGRGEVGFAVAEEFISRLGPVVADWPLIIPTTDMDLGPGWRPLVHSLIAEETARAKDLPVAQRVMLAIGTGVAYSALNEIGAAEYAFARAEDLLATGDPDDPVLQDARITLATYRADILDGSGRTEEARRLRAENDPAPILSRVVEDDPIADLGELDPLLARGADALAGGRFPEALAILGDLHARLGDRLTNLDPADERRPLYEHRWSGLLGNLGATLSEIADLLEAAREGYGGRPAGSQITRTVVTDPGLILAKLRPLLWTHFPDGFPPEAVRAAAIALLEEAIKHATAIEAWEFAAIQGQRLVVALDHAGRDAMETAALTANWAARAGAHSRGAVMHGYLADRAVRAADFGTALAELSQAAAASIRNSVGTGHRTELAGFEAALAASLLDVVEGGGDVVTAALILENLKAATTASALTTGFPVGPAPTELLQRRERLRLELNWNPDDEQTLAALRHVESELDTARAAARLRDPGFLRWVDAIDHRLTDAAALTRRLPLLSPGARYLGCTRIADRIATYLLGGTAPRMVIRPLPELSDAALPTWLIAPFAAELAGLGQDERLVISPDLSLPGVAFAAAELGGDVLAERVIVSLVPGVAALEVLLDREVSGYTRVVSVGSPSRPDLPDLPGARMEARFVAEMAPEGTMLIGPQATVPALYGQAGEADVLHFACHAAISGPADPHGRLLLAPDLTADDSGELSEDRIIAELRLSPGCLVNLAGCHTAHQELRNSPLLGGLVPALLVAGASGVLASVVALPDHVTLAFQREFYQQLAQGESAAQALAICQRRARAGDLGPELRDRSAWAGYVLYGI